MTSSTDTKKNFSFNLYTSGTATISQKPEVTLSPSQRYQEYQPVNKANSNYYNNKEVRVEKIVLKLH